MYQIVAGVNGIGEACRALDFPVISGNCSLYNETNGEGILPTPAIGAVGLMADVHRMAAIGFRREGDTLILIGRNHGHLGQSIYLREIEGREDGAAPPVHLTEEKRHGDFVRNLIEQGTADTVHDLSDGGLLVAVAEMAMAGGIGAELVAAPDATASIPFFFGEDQGRYLIAAAADTARRIADAAEKAGIPHALIGRTINRKLLSVAGAGEVTLERLSTAHENWFPDYMGGLEPPPVN